MFSHDFVGRSGRGRGPSPPRRPPRTRWRPRICRQGPPGGCRSANVLFRVHFGTACRLWGAPARRERSDHLLWCGECAGPVTRACTAPTDPPFPFVQRPWTIVNPGNRIMTVLGGPRDQDSRERGWTEAGPCNQNAIRLQGEPAGSVCVPKT